MRNFLRKNRLILIIALGLTPVLFILVYTLANKNNPAAVVKPALAPTSSSSPSSKVVPATSGKGETSGRGTGQTAAPVSQTPLAQPSQSTPVAKPIGQVLNKTVISLSAAPTDGKNNTSMVSTIIKASPGSTNSIIATDSRGTKLTVGGPAVADANGQGPEINWDAEAAGLTQGIWQVQILSQIDGGSSTSDIEQLTVNK